MVEIFFRLRPTSVILKKVKNITFHPLALTKLLTIYFDRAFSAKFSTPPSGKTMDGTQKRIGPTMMARTTSIAMKKFGGNRAMHVGVRG